MKRTVMAQPGAMPVVTAVAECTLPTRWAEFRLRGFRDETTGREHLALLLGKVDDGSPVLARLHSECLTGDALFSRRCDCGPQLELAMRRIAKEGRGVILYLRQEGRGIGLLNKLRAYELQDGGLDTVDANAALGLPIDDRRYGVAAAMLRALGIESVRLLTNNPEKAAALTAAGIAVGAQLPHVAGVNGHNRRYMVTKAKHLGHHLPFCHFPAAKPR